MKALSKSLKVAASLLLAGTVLSGCVYYPAGPAYAYAGAPYYRSAYYGPRYYGPGYYAPPVTIGVWGGGRGYWR